MWKVMKVTKIYWLISLSVILNYPISIVVYAGLFWFSNFRGDNFLHGTSALNRTVLSLYVQQMWLMQVSCVHVGLKDLSVSQMQEIFLEELTHCWLCAEMIEVSGASNDDRDCWMPEGLWGLSMSEPITLSKSSLWLSSESENSENSRAYFWLILCVRFSLLTSLNIF